MKNLNLNGGLGRKGWTDIGEVLREISKAVEEWPGPEGRKEKPRKALAAIAGIVRGETSSGA